jgi:uncharacterized protein (TIGR02271 family)
MQGTDDEMLGGAGMTEAYTWEGRELIDRAGESVGMIDSLYRSSEAGRPEWAAVRTGFFGTKLTFVPIGEARPSGDRVRVPVTKEHIKDAPRIAPGGELSLEEEEQLYRHYGISDWDRSAASHPETAATTRPPVEESPSAGDDAMTRSEEEVTIGTARRERGRARLRKYVVTEEVRQTVPVEREEVRIEREPITDENVDAAMAGPEISTAEHEVVLHEEQPVVEKHVTPKERVRLEKETRVDEQEVSEDVRKERIEAEGEVDR